MSVFTASNGMTVERDHNLDVLIGRGTETMSLFMADGTALALREFFRAEEDERLGRWRWPADPRFVVYPAEPDDEDGAIRILFEEGGGSSRHYTRKWLESVRDPDGWSVARCARAYFDAHPEPKPWDAAKPGEVWAFKIEDLEGEFAASLHTDGKWTWAEGGHVNVAPGGLLSGRRIFPEAD